MKFWELCVSFPYYIMRDRAEQRRGAAERGEFLSIGAAQWWVVGSSAEMDKHSPNDSILHSVKHARPMSLQTVFAITHSYLSIMRPVSRAIKKLETLPDCSA